MGIKYKLGLYNNYPRNIHAATVCSYCNHGQPEVISINLNESSSVSTLFSDLTLNAHGHKLLLSVATRLSFLIEIMEVQGKWVLHGGPTKYVMEELGERFN
jgi:hypothetical protein